MQYKRRVGFVEARQVTELEQVVGVDGNLTAHPGDYVVQAGVKQVATWTEAGGSGTRDIPVYEVIARRTFESEHEVPQPQDAEPIAGA